MKPPSVLLPALFATLAIHLMGGSANAQSVNQSTDQPTDQSATQPVAQPGVGGAIDRILADILNAATKESVPSQINLADEMIAAHNSWRSSVGVSPLQWSEELAGFAQEWANYLAAENLFEHRPDNSYGENLAYRYNMPASPANVVDAWGSEIADYDYSTNTCIDICGHYTQLVWETTTEVGCAVARSGDEEYWVCNYNPPGNYIGQRPY